MQSITRAPDWSAAPFSARQWSNWNFTMSRQNIHAPETPATRFLRQHGVAHSNHLYEYEEHGGTTVSGSMPFPVEIDFSTDMTVGGRTARN
ncbi:protein of unknown function [Thauera humireducens]|nr:protein of unknown function [Thauera humireducens]